MTEDHSETPRLVIYYEDNSVPLINAVDLPYTHVNLSFLVPVEGTDRIVAQDNLTLEVLEHAKRVQESGKQVFASFGGGLQKSQHYHALSGNERQAAEQIVDYVIAHRLDGVDIDYEDFDAMRTGKPYDGVEFLSTLTALVHEMLPAECKVVTHSPEISCVSEGDPVNYGRVLRNVGARIAWLNVQYYNAPEFIDPNSKVVQSYQRLVEGTNGFEPIPPQQLVLGKPFGQPTQRGGFMPVDEIISDLVRPLQSAYGKEFGGVMGWQFSRDPNGDWARRLGKALGIG